MPSLTTLVPQTSCADGQARLTAALAQWAAEEAQLEGAPLAADERAELRRRGGADAKTAEAYRPPPPPSPNVRVTSCPR